MASPFFGVFFSRVLPSKWIKGKLWDRWYRYFNRKVEHESLRFMNFGLALYDHESLNLQATDELERTSIQLYDRVVSACNLTGTRVLEVSCGRGGGADYLVRYKKLAQVSGLDRTPNAVAFCRKVYPADNLHFTCGDAMSLPFPDDTFDAVVNVEASHCYPDMPKFLSEVRRVLKPGGRFLYADFRRDKLQEAWHQQLQASGLKIEVEEDITRRVVDSLFRTNERRTSLMRSIAPRPLRRVFFLFAGTKGSMMYRAFDMGRAKYIRFCMRKP
ncbi:MAG: class I SAM-dependent methyltransferase [Planctomycetes bacterium]|nr:class I SAM-dependent methyltransferase [Planctomycetota bacterium]MBI3835699.1 class I SAM-dependent methyltransferase [Planctomycetota bacterium]